MLQFVSPDTFEQIDVKKDLFGKNAMYLQGMFKKYLQL